MIEAALLAAPTVIAAICKEHAFPVFALVAVCAFLAGFAITRKKPRNTTFFLKEGCAATALSWTVMSLVGCLPFWISGAIPSFTNAFFETVSGFTTTGSSILSDVESLPLSCLFWRSFTHWIGGMGMLVFLMAVVPLSGGSQINLMKAESPGPTVGKLVPKMRQTATILYLIYLAMTVAEWIILMLGRMAPMEALMISFGTAGTGGFGVRNTGCADYSAFQQWVIAIFMTMFGVNFNAYYFILMKRFKEAFKIEEIRWYFAMVGGAVLLIFVTLMRHGALSAGTAVRDTFFQVASLSTSTGFSSVDFDMWPNFAKAVLFFVMFIGACAGSTGGGLKMSRILILAKSFRIELYAYLHPKGVKKLKSDGRTVAPETVKSVEIYFFVFFVILFVSFLLISLEGRDMITSLSTALTSLNNMGPGFGAAGPTANFGSCSYLTKYVMIFNMLAGRLELFPVLILIHPSVAGGLVKRVFRRRK